MSITNFLADILFPPYCVYCNEPGEWWCKECRAKVHKVRGGVCAKCLQVGEHECNGELPFVSVQAFGYYHDPKLRSIITNIKFNGAYALESALRKFVQENADLLSVGNVDCIVPMPLSEKRIKDRGFNQALIVARVLKKVSYKHVPLEDDLLSRVVNSDPQSSLSNDFELRSCNIADSFVCTGPVPERVLLVDDVVTTGATAGEAARMMLSAGAKRVDLVTLAIGA